MLSSSNLVSLLCLLLMVGLRFTTVYPYRTTYCIHWYESFISLSIPYLTPINQFFQMSGIYLIIAVSIDRLILVIRSKDMKITSRMRKKRRLITWIVIFLIFLFCFLFTLPNWYLYTSKLVELNVTLNELSSSFSYSYSKNQTSTLFKLSYYKNEFTQFGKKSLVMNLLNVYLYIPFVFAIPILVLTLVNLLIICELVQIGARKRQLGSAANIDRNITIMLVMIVILFLVCQVPLAFSHIFIAYKPEMMFDKTFFLYHSFTNFLTCIYLSANFILFCFFGQEFRDTMKFMFFIRSDLPYYSNNNLKRRFTFQSFYQSINKRNLSSEELTLQRRLSRNRAISLKLEMIKNEEIIKEPDLEVNLAELKLKSIRLKELRKYDSNIHISEKY
jgi:hypothetical protein